MAHSISSRLFIFLFSNLWLAIESPAIGEETEKINSAQLPASLRGPNDRAADSVYVLSLSFDRQKQSGLQTQPLAAVSQLPETLAYGKILDIRPLLELRARYRSAQSEVIIAGAALRVARKNRERLAELHSKSIIPTRELVQAESQLAADQAREQEAKRHMREVRDEALQAWGNELFRQAVEIQSRLFQGLVNHSLALALVALPAGQTLPRETAEIAVNPIEDRERARKAQLLSPAPKTEESTQGETWYFVTESTGLRTGMRLDAWIPRGGKSKQGVRIPLSAVVWRDGRPWVFVRNGPESFVRRPVESRREQADSWFVTEGFAPGEEAVVVGGQMLLSEEQRRTDSNSPGDED